MNRRSQMDAAVNLFRLVAAIFIFFIVVSIVRGFVKQSIDTNYAESKILTHRLFFARDVNYFDESINRTYVGVIDLQKFNSDNFAKSLLESIYYGKINSEASARILLRDMETNKKYEKYYNEGIYKEKKVLVEAKLTGAGSARRLNTVFAVIIKDGDKIKNGVLDIDAILPNS